MLLMFKVGWRGEGFRWESQECMREDEGCRMREWRSESDERMRLEDEESEVGCDLAF